MHGLHARLAATGQQQQWSYQGREANYCLKEPQTCFSNVELSDLAFYIDTVSPHTQIGFPFSQSSTSLFHCIFRCLCHFLSELTSNYTSNSILIVNSFDALPNAQLTVSVSEQKCHMFYERSVRFSVTYSLLT